MTVAAVSFTKCDIGKYFSHGPTLRKAGQASVMIFSKDTSQDHSYLMMVSPSPISKQFELKRKSNWYIVYRFCPPLKFLNNFNLNRN